MQPRDGLDCRGGGVVFGPILVIDKVGHILDVMLFKFTLRIWLTGNLVSSTYAQLTFFLLSLFYFTFPNCSLP